MAVRLWATFGLALALTGCGGNPWKSGTAVTPVVPVDPLKVNVPAAVSKDMNGFSYTSGELKIDLTGLIASGGVATFQRKSSLDINSHGNGQPNYLAYTYQETGLQRAYLAYVATNARGNLIATSTSDGGQFNENNAGGRYARISAFTRPTIAPAKETGLFAYAGSYAGIFTPGEWVDANRPPGLRPAEPWEVRGTAQINANFATDASSAKNLVEGGITDRRLYDGAGQLITAIVLNGAPPIDVSGGLADLTLRETAINSNGEFLGNVEFHGHPDVDIGDYAGAFGGLGASDVAAVLWLNPIDGQSGIWEYGTLNLPRCDMAGASPICLPR